MFKSIIFYKKCNKRNSVSDIHYLSRKSAIYNQQHSQYLKQFSEIQKKIKIQKMQLDQCDVLIDKILDMIPKNLIYFEGLQIKIESCQNQFNLYDFENIMEQFNYDNDTRQLNLKKNFEKIFEIQQDLSHLQDEINSLKKTNKKFSKSIKKVEEKQYNKLRFIKLKEDQNGQNNSQKDNQEFLWNENPYFEPIEVCQKLTENLMIAKTQHLILCFNLSSKSVTQYKNPINITIYDKITFTYFEPNQQFSSKIKFLIMTDYGYIILTKDRIYSSYMWNFNMFHSNKMFQIKDIIELCNEPIHCQIFYINNSYRIYVCANENGKFEQFYFQLSKKMVNYNPLASGKIQLEQKEVNNWLKENLQIKQIALKKISAYYLFEFYYTNGHDLIIKIFDERWDEGQNDQNKKQSYSQVPLCPTN